MKGFGIKCINFNKTVGHEIRNQTFRILFTVFIKVVLIRYSGLSWFTQSKEQVKFKFEQQCPSWIQNRNWYNTTIRSHLCGSSFEYIFITARQDRYALICSLNLYEKLHVMCYDSLRCGYGRPLPYGPTTGVIRSVSSTINSICIWLQTGSIPIFPLRSYSMVCRKNDSYFLVNNPLPK